MGFFSRLFGRAEKSRKEQEARAAMHRLFERALGVLNDDGRQNAFMPDALREAIEKSPGLGAKGKGEFGRNLQNPIPVNGPLGEIAYLSRLKSAATGSLLGFHRLGSLDRIDVYETFSLDGSGWDILFFDYYHLKKSDKTPEGYIFAGRVEGLTGTNRFIPSFPADLRDFAMHCASDIFGAPIVNPTLRDIKFQRRNDAHSRRVHVLLDTLAERNNPNTIIEKFLALEAKVNGQRASLEQKVVYKILREALQFVQYPPLRHMWISPALPPSLRDDRSCLEICCLKCAHMRKALATYGADISEEFSRVVVNEICEAFSGYADIRPAVDDGILFYSRQSFEWNSEEGQSGFLTVFGKRLAQLHGIEDKYIQYYMLIWAAHSIFFLNELNAFGSVFFDEIKQYILAKKHVEERLSGNSGIDAVIADLHSKLAAFIRNTLSTIPDMEAVALFAEAFPLAVLASDAVAVPDSGLYQQTYAQWKSRRFEKGDCLFAVAFKRYDAKKYLNALFNMEEWGRIDLDTPDFDMLNDLAFLLEGERCDDLSAEASGELLDILRAATVGVAACLGLGETVYRAPEGKPAESHAAPRGVGPLPEGEEMLPQGHAPRSESFDWPAIEDSLSEGLPGDAEFNRVETEFVESEYALACNQARLAALRSGVLPERALVAGGRALSPKVPRFDLSRYMGAYTKLRMRPGWELDYVYALDHHGGEPFPYARKHAEPSLKDAREYCAFFNRESLGMLLGNEPTLPQTYPYLRAMEIQPDKFGLFELALFCMTVRRFYLFWHSLYNDRMFFFSQKQLKGARSVLDQFSEEQYNSLFNYDFRPQVASIGAFHRVSMLTYEQSRGVSFLRMYFNRHFFVSSHDVVILPNSLHVLY